VKRSRKGVHGCARRGRAAELRVEARARRSWSLNWLGDKRNKKKVADSLPAVLKDARQASDRRDEGAAAVVVARHARTLGACRLSMRAKWHPCTADVRRKSEADTRARGN
jgi:hypothetical protein